MAEDFYQAPSEEFSQGDIFEVLPHALITGPLEHVEGNTDPVVSECKRDRAILLTHDCDIDKPLLRSWLICPVHRLDTVPKGMQGDIKKNRAFAFLHLAQHRDTLPASFVDFRHVTALSPDVVRSAKRLASLSDTGKKALYLRFIQWLTRWQLADLQCPNCSVEFNPADSLRLR